MPKLTITSAQQDFNPHHMYDEIIIKPIPFFKIRFTKALHNYLNINPCTPITIDKPSLFSLPTIFSSLSLNYGSRIHVILSVELIPHFTAVLRHYFDLLSEVASGNDENLPKLELTITAAGDFNQYSAIFFKSIVHYGQFIKSNHLADDFKPKFNLDLAKSPANISLLDGLAHAISAQSILPENDPLLQSLREFSQQSPIAPVFLPGANPGF